ncbi:MAG: DUF692 domain-containing protein [Candidatus Eremiobacteraeota bacterium]|nr:DUF692 domain-containing protein [Candidatus Eremiobacteraeota bacterium]
MSIANKWGFPDLGFGMGLRTVHYSHILQHWPAIDFFEIIVENYMGSGGRPIYMLEQIAERYPVMLHGVSLSVGSTDPVDFEYLKLLKNLINLVKARWVSDHLCWTGILGRNTHDLLPMPLTEESLTHVTQRVKVIQDFLEVPLVLENPSTYLEWAQDQLTEWDYLNALTAEADCGLLLDVNNVYVSSYNHGFSAQEYIQKISAQHVVYHHLSGHTNNGTYIVDTHDDHVIDEVWALYTQCYQRMGGRSTMVEWDAEIPPFEVVHAEVLKAAACRKPVVTSVG